MKRKIVRKYLKSYWEIFSGFVVALGKGGVYAFGILFAAWALHISKLILLISIFVIPAVIGMCVIVYENLKSKERKSIKSEPKAPIHPMCRCVTMPDERIFIEADGHTVAECLKDGGKHDA